MDSRYRLQGIQLIASLQLGLGHSVLLGVLTEPFSPIPTGQSTLERSQPVLTITSMELSRIQRVASSPVASACSFFRVVRILTSSWTAIVLNIEK